MYTLFNNISIRQLLGERLPLLAASLAIAEIFYKFHSFVLEALAFLATWFVLDWFVAQVRATVTRRGSDGDTNGTFATKRQETQKR